MKEKKIVFMMVMMLALLVLPATLHAGMLKEKNIKLYVGEEMKVPTKSLKNLKFTSSNPTAASVSKSGLISAKKVGNAVITVRKRNGGEKEKLRVSVKKYKCPSIALDQKIYVVEKGRTAHIKVKSVKGLSSKAVIYKSKNPNVAKVLENGMIETREKGIAYIVATSATNPKVSVKCAIVVIEAYTKDECEYSGMIVDREPACEEDGEMSMYCRIHGERTRIMLIPALGHSFGEWGTDETSSGKNGILQMRVCNICGKKEICVIPAVGHDDIGQEIAGEEDEGV